MPYEDWNNIARLHGYPNMKAYLIHRYILEGKGSVKLCRELGCNRHTVLNLVKAAGITPRGAKLILLTPAERATWERALVLEGYPLPGVQVDVTTPYPADTHDYPDYDKPGFTRYKRVFEEDV